MNSTTTETGNGTLGVLVAGQQQNPTAQQDFERLVSRITNGDVRGVVLANEAASPVTTDVTTTRSGNVRRGMIRGAGAGFLIGLLPLIATTIVAAIAGGLIARASELRFEKGSAPRLRFPRRQG